jgi:hypothetical protein
MLIKGTDSPRANIARLAADTAKLVTSEFDVPALQAILQEVGKVVPGASFTELCEPLPLSDDIRAALLTPSEAEQS